MSDSDTGQSVSEGIEACAHPARSRVVDEHVGDEVCSDCGLVVDPSSIYCVNRKDADQTGLTPRGGGVYQMALDVFCNNHLPMSLYESCCRFYRQMVHNDRSRVATERNIRAMAYATYMVLNDSQSAAARSAADIRDMYGVDTVGRLLSVGRKSDLRNFVADIVHPQTMVDHYCAKLDIPYSDMMDIKDLYSKLWSKRDDYCKPRTIAASLIAYYNSDPIRVKHSSYPASLSMKDIALSCEVSVTNVAKMVKKLRLDAIGGA